MPEFKLPADIITNTTLIWISSIPYQTRIETISTDIPEGVTLVGNLAKQCIDTLNSGKVFLGIDGCTFDTGITGRDMMRSEIAGFVTARGTEIFILTDSSKFGRINMSKYCPLEDVDHIITDSDISSEYRDYFQSHTDLIIT